MQPINIQAFIDTQTGLVAGADGGKDNEMLDTATLSFVQNGLDTPMKTNLSAFISNTTIAPGVYTRYPKATDNSVDNYVGLVYVSDSDALKTWERGEANLWCFNPENPNQFKLKYFFGRFIGFRPFVKARALQRLNIFEAFLYAISCFFTSLSQAGNTSDKCLQILMNDKVKGKHWVSDLGIAAFNKIMSRKYPAGIRSVYSIYFGANHPFTLAAPDTF